MAAQRKRHRHQRTKASAPERDAAEGTGAWSEMGVGLAMANDGAAVHRKLKARRLL